MIVLEANVYISGRIVTFFEFQASVRFHRHFGGFLHASHNSRYDTRIFNVRSKNKKLRYHKKTARCFVSLNISLSCSRSLKVIRNGSIRKLGYSSLIAFYSNDSRICSRFWDIQRQRMAWPWILFGVVRGHWKWCCSIDYNTTFCWSAIVCIALFCTIFELFDGEFICCMLLITLLYCDKIVLGVTSTVGELQCT